MATWQQSSETCEPNRTGARDRDRSRRHDRPGRTAAACADSALPNRAEQSRVRHARSASRPARATHPCRLPRRTRRPARRLTGRLRPDRGPRHLEPHPHRARRRRQLPAAVRSVNRHRCHLRRHRRVQHLCSGPGRRGPCGHPGLQPHLRDSRQHRSGRCQGQHRYHGHGRSHLLAERRQGRRRLRGLLQRGLGRGGHGTQRDRSDGYHHQHLGGLDGQRSKRDGKDGYGHHQPRPGQCRQ